MWRWSKEFESLKAYKSKCFESKPETTVFPIKFNGLWTDKLIGKRGFVTHQLDYCHTAKELNPSLSSSEDSMAKKISVHSREVVLHHNKYKVRRSLLYRPTCSSGTQQISNRALENSEHLC